MQNANFKDVAAERTIIGTLIRYGKDALIDAQAYVDSKDFSLPQNRAIFTCLQNLSEDPACQTFDIDSIKLKAKALGLDNYLSGKKEQEYLNLLPECNASVDNIPMFAMQIKKYSVIRDLYQRYQDAQNYLVNTSGSEQLSEIIRNAESKIVNYVDGTENENILEDLCSEIQEEIQYKLDHDVVSQVGIPTGFPKYDKAIGGGLRGSAIAVVASRSKVGKGFFAMNVGRNVAKLGIPVLYLDTEMSKKVQLSRLISIDSGCPIEKYETGKFKLDKDLREKVINTGRNLKSFTLKYEAVAGMSHTEILAIARRWLTKVVGFNEKGQAKDCVIIYDYIKLTNPEDIARNISETISLGFLMTDLNAFAVKYNVPFLAFAQMNRDGIDNDDTSIIACSDRILWLCSSLSSLRNKSIDDEENQCGFEYGNKKLKILDTRYGCALPYEYDYINIYAGIRPRVAEDQANGRFQEGELYSTVTGKNEN